jgi:hypothetical protein
MALKRKTVGLAMLLVVLAPHLNSGGQEGPAIKTIHVFNLSSPQEEARLRAILNEFNQLFSTLGFPNVSYRLWRLQEEWPGQFSYRYVYDSTWPDRETYDKVHQNIAYQKLLEKHLMFFTQVLNNEIYGEYLELEFSEKKE